MSGSNVDWAARIGPCRSNAQQKRDDAAFVAALKQIRPEDIMGDSRSWGAEREEEERQRRIDHANANHPTIHGNRIEKPGNVNVHKTHPVPLPEPAKPATLVRGPLPGAFMEPIQPRLEPSHEPHPVQATELPSVVGPEAWVDRYTHEEAFHAIVKLETGFYTARPIISESGTYLETVIDMAMTGRVWDIVRQHYTDVGWREVSKEDKNKETRVWMFFP